MSVNVRVPGKDTTNVKSFSVQEDATPIDPSSSTGGVGQITVGMDNYTDAPRLIGDLILTDGNRGKTSGNIRTITNTDGALTLTADSTLGMFNTERVVPPFIGTLGDAIQYYCDLVGIDNDVAVDADISSRAVIYPAWTGNVWVGIKQILAKEQIEMALVFDRISVRSLRALNINQDRKSTDGFSIDNNNAAQSVEVYYYNNSYGAQKEVFPLPETTDLPALTVNANQTVTITQQLNASMITINQPVVQDFVNNTSYAGTNGVYSVVGNDSLPITASQWTAQGGSLVVSITNDPSIIEITLKGPNNTGLSPYRVAMSSGSSNYYNSLHITGTAVVWDKKLLTLKTGVPASQTSIQVGVTVDNPFISTLQDALSTGVRTSGAYAGLNYTVSGSAFNVNRKGEGRDLIQATIADFNVAYTPGTSIASFNSSWSGQTVADFNAYWMAQVDMLWENQLFGNVTGARVLNKDANFRVISATTTESSVQYSAALDTIVDDFNTEWSGVVTSTTRANLSTNPRATAYLSAADGSLGWSSARWFGPSPWAGAYSLVTNADGPSGTDLITYARKTWTVASTGSPGDIGFQTNTWTGVLPNTVYTASGWMRTSIVGRTSVGFEFAAFDSTGIVSRLNISSTSIAANTWTRFSGAFTTPASLSNMVFILDTDGGTAPVVGSTIDITGLLIEQVGTTGTVSRTNLHSNPVVGRNTTGWSFSSAGGTWTVTRETTAGSTTGMPNTTSTWYKMLASVTNTSANPGLNTNDSSAGTTDKVPVQAGLTYTASAHFVSSYVTSGFLIYQWWDASGAIIGSAVSTTPMVNSANAWLRLSTGTITAPTGAVWLSVHVRSTAAIGAFPVSGYIGATSVLVERASTLGPYFDGSTVGGVTTEYSWVGASYNSSSVARQTSTPATLAYFDGSNADTHARGITTMYDWTGAANASTSTQIATTGDYLVSDFNDQFAGMTMKDYNVIPLRKDY